MMLSHGESFDFLGRSAHQVSSPALELAEETTLFSFANRCPCFRVSSKPRTPDAWNKVIRI